MCARKVMCCCVCLVSILLANIELLNHGKKVIIINYTKLVSFLGSDSFDL